MTNRTTMLLTALACGVFVALGDAGASDPQVASDYLYRGLPPQEPNSVRLGVQEPADVDVEVSIKRQTMRCDELEAHVVVLQSGGTRAESFACFGVGRPSAITELVVGHDAARHHYRITFAYSHAEHTVAYGIRRLAGAGVVESQRVVVDVGQAS